ncbi:MAG: hypothetical protein K2O28_06300 [Clostridia bacterium]|nr:hypothetical protein [Clostridia bacterium]
MMKMLIQLDEQKVKTDGIYDLADMWRIIDGKFEKACTKEVQPDGSRLYVGDTSKDYYTCISLSYMGLSELQWFAQYCSKWIWYDNDDDESEPFSEEDVLARERIRNLLFAKV